MPAARARQAVYRTALLPLATLLAGGCGGDNPCERGLTVGESLDGICTSRPAPGSEPRDVPVVGDAFVLAGTGVAGPAIDGALARHATLYAPIDVTVGPDGLVYISDFDNQIVRRIDPAGYLRTVAGTGTLVDPGGDAPYEPFANGPVPATSVRLIHPAGVAFDATGRMYIADWHGGRVERVDLLTGLMDNFAGSGARSFSGDGGPAAEASFNLPASVSFATDGSALIGDEANFRVRRVDGRTGIASTVAGVGTAGYSGDGGPATRAGLATGAGSAVMPGGRAVSTPEGGFYYADTYADRVRRVDAQGVIATVAGSGERGYSGDGASSLSARLASPADVARGRDGTLYIADTANHCVRAVGSDGIIHTVAGRCGEPGVDEGRRPALETHLRSPFGIDVDRDGNLFVADTNNHRVLEVCLVAAGACHPQR